MSPNHGYISDGSWAAAISQDTDTMPLCLLRLPQITENTFNTKERSSTTTVSCGQRQQHLRGHREDIAVVDPYSSLWPKGTTFERSQRGVFLVASPTVHCGQRPQQLGDQSVYYNSGILDHSGHLFSTEQELLALWRGDQQGSQHRRDSDQTVKVLSHTNVDTGHKSQAKHKNYLNWWYDPPCAQMR